MKRVLYIFTSLFFGILSFLLGYFIHAGNLYSLLGFSREVIQDGIHFEEKEDVLSINTELKPSVFAQELKPIFEKPVSMHIKKIDEAGNPLETKIVEADLIEIDVNSEGQMENPKDWNKAGWYKRSSLVGEEGNIIINGHYDDNYGRPAAFYNLKTVKDNDRVYLVDSFGRNFVYQVTETFYVSIYDDDRIAKVLESDGASLTLITCGGVWVPQEGTYNNRLVVKAKKME
jgi:LPXTG-site transpeptidase (sortase) family protein